MASLDKTLRYPCLLCIPTLMRSYPATFSWVDDILSIPSNTKTLTQYVVKQPAKKVIPPIVSFSFRDWISKGEIIAKMGSNKTGTLQRLKTKETVGYFVCEDPFKR